MRARGAPPTHRSASGDRLCSGERGCHDGWLTDRRLVQPTPGARKAESEKVVVQSSPGGSEDQAFASRGIREFLGHPHVLATLSGEEEHPGRHLNSRTLARALADRPHGQRSHLAVFIRMRARRRKSRANSGRGQEWKFVCMETRG